MVNINLHCLGKHHAAWVRVQPQAECGHTPGETSQSADGKVKAASYARPGLRRALRCPTCGCYRLNVCGEKNPAELKEALGLAASSLTGWLCWGGNAVPVSLTRRRSERHRQGDRPSQPDWV